MKNLTPLFSRPAFSLLGLLGILVTGIFVINCKNKTPDPLLPKASFRLENNNCTAPCDPGITNLSQYAQTYRWDFGDGGTATDENPKHPYAKGGTYALKLTVTGEQNLTSDTTVTVTIVSAAPVAAFTVQNDNCTVTCEISFTNQSQNAQSYQWDFGDGGTSTEAAPKHKYTKGGSFTVKLTIMGEQGKTAVTTQIVTVKSPPLPVAAFIIQNDNCIAPCTVVLQNQSLNATSYSWTIVTGYVADKLYISGYRPTSRTTVDVNPTQSYSYPAPFSFIGVSGNGPRLPYTVELTAIGPGGTQKITKNITIREPAPVADFTYSVANGKVNFTNKSKNADSYLWNFGNGATSTDENPTTSYGAAGSYTVSVSLKATNSTATSEIKKNIGITVVK